MRLRLGRVRTFALLRYIFIQRPRAFPQRFTGRLEDDRNTIVGRWEKAEDGENYETDFDLIDRKVK